MKPELIRHLTDTEFIYCNLGEDKELIKAWKKEYEKRSRLFNHQPQYCLGRDYVNQRWELGY